MIPLMIDLRGRPITIFGGGEVGARKAAYFVGEAHVTVISRSFSPEVRDLPVRLVEEDLSSVGQERIRELIGDAFAVVAATPDEALNDRIGECCREHGILFNSARGEQGDFLIPSVVRGGQYLLAVSTEGATPAVSRFLREYLEGRCPGLDAMIAIQARLRAVLRAKEPLQKRRETILREVLRDPAIWAMLPSEKEKAWDEIVVRYLHG
jgi:precorrin-2 dehydrogenase/sirohydrochlorin ferrochelatase